MSHQLIAGSKRIALVIGNGSYQNSPLANPVNDAHLMAKNLKKMGFSVILKTDATQQIMDDAIEQFGVQLENGGVGLFFYAGHGIQSKGRNYLIPVKSRLNREKDLKYNAVDAGKILDEMDNANNGLNIVILDACRNNPLTRSFRGSSRGLSRFDDVPTGLLLAYSTSPGNVAADGKGKNSPYTEALIKAMNQPRKPLELVFKDALKQVKKNTRGQQIPWFNSSVEGDFFFIDKEKNIPERMPLAGSDSNILRIMENNFWNDVQADPSNEMYTAYLEEYPDGRYARIAKIKLKKHHVPLQSDEMLQLNICAAHFNANRLTFGRTGNALNCYQQILLNNPDNSLALSGIKKIEDKYFDWASFQLKKGKLNKAQTYLNKLKSVNPDNAQIQWLQNTLSEKQKHQARSIISLSSPNLSVPELATIKEGCFQMGSQDSEKNRDTNEHYHRVCVGEFKLMTHEVTKAQFRSFVNTIGYRTDAEKTTAGNKGCLMDKTGNGNWSFVAGTSWKKVNYQQLDNHPVVCVSHNDAVAYSKWLSRKTGKKFRLPTEAEWEYAARAGINKTFYWGDDNNYKHLCDYANSANSEIKERLSWASSACHDGHKYTAPKKSYKPNNNGLYDMSGNVWEWTCSAYKESEKECSNGSGKRSLRGGSWNSRAELLRSANRDWISTISRNASTGFRLVQEL